MHIIDRIDRVATATPNRVAHTVDSASLTYGRLKAASDSVASRLGTALPRDGSPVVVYGHKESAMLVAFLGCVKAGHPYVPIDASWPYDRITGVIRESGTRLVISVRPLPHEVDLLDVEVWDGSSLETTPAPIIPTPISAQRVGDDEPYYVIYTSGSTGRPKGVQITAGALGRFTDWALSLADDPRVPEAARRDAVWLNHAPFSFDLSVMDLYGALASGGTLHSVTSATVANARDLHADLRASGVTVWVSTPSFADLCLADPGFGRELLPNLGLFLFCGETLSPTTVAALHDRFPGAAVYNTYGPTESTVAVTSVLVTPEMLDGSPLVVGTAKPGTTIVIRDADDHDVPVGTSGEIVIAGDTVSIGYLHRPDLTEAVFGTITIDGLATPAYRTGDRGRLDPDGQLHFGGRLDNQVKLHGYRIELEDIENNLRRLDDVQQAAVVAVRTPDGQVTHLQAYVQLDHTPEQSPLAFATSLKKRFRQFVPDYMVPKVITVVESIPLTGNGKVDRRALASRERS